MIVFKAHKSRFNTASPFTEATQKQSQTKKTVTRKTQLPAFHRNLWVSRKKTICEEEQRNA